jgi:hypothetical protein
MASHRRNRPAYLLCLGLTVAALLLAGCAGEKSPADADAASTTAAAGQASGAQTPTRISANVPAGERQWAAQALQILDTVNTGINQFHDSTAAPEGSSRAYALRQQAYATLAQAVDAYQQILPETEALQDTALRDQFMFLMGNVSGFLHPTPDLPGDPPTLGDRIGRSLQNAITTGAALRPKLQQLASQS